MIKICGMTSKADIDICSENNVDIVGFLLQPASKTWNRADMLDLDIAQELIAYVPKPMESCLLIHLKDIEKVLSIIDGLKPTIIQIQKESKLSINELKKINFFFPNIKIIKTFYIVNSVNISELTNEINLFINSKTINYILLDSGKGGCGQIHNWDISEEIVKTVAPFPILLAGGLNSDNISNAIKKVSPYGVDVMTGVSKKSYSKDQNKITLFINNAKNL